MVEDFADSPHAHIFAMCTFIDNTGLSDEVRTCDWTAFARGYNGPAFAKHAYHHRIGKAWARRAGLTWLRRGAVGPEVANLQTLLAREGHDPGTIDGAFGPKTNGALLAFQKASLKPYPLYEPRTETKEA